MGRDAEWMGGGQPGSQGRAAAEPAECAKLQADCP